MRCLYKVANGAPNVADILFGYRENDPREALGQLFEVGGDVVGVGAAEVGDAEGGGAFFQIPP